MTAAGCFYGIGLGPGDPELLTRKAARVLGEVNRIYYPTSVHSPAGFAARVMDDLRLDTSRFRPVVMSMSRRRDADQEVYGTAARTILEELHRGLEVAWVTEGDPLFYSTFVHVWAALRAAAPQIAVEIVPGITSMQAAAARAGVVAASLDDSVAVVPAAYGLCQLPELMHSCTTVFLLKVNRVFDRLLDSLKELPGKIDAYYVEKVGTPEERIVRDLASLRGQQLPYFSLVILRGQAKIEA